MDLYTAKHQYRISKRQWRKLRLRYISIEEFVKIVMDTPIELFFRMEQLYMEGRLEVVDVIIKVCYYQ